MYIFLHFLNICLDLLSLIENLHLLNQDDIDGVNSQSDGDLKICLIDLVYVVNFITSKQEKSILIFTIEIHYYVLFALKIELFSHSEPTFLGEDSDIFKKVSFIFLRYAFFQISQYSSDLEIETIIQIKSFHLELL